MSTRPGSTLAAMALVSLGPEEPDDPELPLPCSRVPAVAGAAGEAAVAERRAVAERATRGARAPRGAEPTNPSPMAGLPARRGPRGWCDPLVACVADTDAGRQEGEGGDAGQHAVAHVVAVPAGRCAGRGGRRPHHRCTRVGGGDRRRAGRSTHRASGCRRGHPWRRCPGGSRAAGAGSVWGTPIGGVSGCWGRRVCPAAGGSPPAGRWPGPWSRAPGSGSSRAPRCPRLFRRRLGLVVLVFGHVRSSV